MLVRRLGGLLAALALAGCATLPAARLVRAGGACRPQLLARVPLAIAQHRLLVPARIGGRAVRLALDTGAMRTVLTDRAALRLGLDADYAMAAALKGVGGAASATVSAPVALSLGGVTLGRRRLLFGLAKSAFGPPARWRHGVPDGLLGLDVLSRFRVDLDIPRLRLSLYRRHPCPDALPPWCRPCLAVPRLPAADPLLHVAVALNGGRLDGVLDTGAMISVTTTAALRRAGIAGLALGRDPAIMGLGATGARGSGRLHRFRRLALGPGLSLSPYVVVLDTSLPTADILVGLNALTRSRIWIAPGATTLAFAPPPARVAAGPTVVVPARPLSAP